MKLALSILMMIFCLSCKTISTEKSDIDTSNKDITISKAKQSETYARGEQVYSNFCVTCHLPDGKGVPGINPPLDGSNWLTEKRKESIHAIKFGLQGPIEVNGEMYNSLMAPLGLSDQEVADVMNYVMNSWSNSIEKPVTLEEVAAVEK
jgi:mono/diheme cytochrome c family protein